MLASSISRKEKVTFEDANRMLTDEVAQWRSILTDDEQFTVPSVGRFILTNDSSTPTFEESHVSIANVYNYGLPELAINAIESDVPHSPTIGKSEQRALSIYRNNIFMRAAASVAILVCVIAGIINATQEIDNGVVRASFFNIEKTAKSEPKIETITLDDTRELRIQKVAESEGTANVAKNSVQSQPLTPRQNFYLVVASLRTQEEADKFIASASKRDGNNQFEVLQKDRRYRVYIHRASTFDDAHSFRNVADNTRLYPDSWVYENKD